VVVALSPAGPFVALVHLRRGSVSVRPGDRVDAGDQVGQCGNSGNSTEPHVHVQVTDSTDWLTARGVPLAFRRSGAGANDPDARWLPQESEIVDAV